MTQSCKTCKHLSVPADKAGRRRTYEGYYYSCTAPMPSPPIAADSIRYYDSWPWEIDGRTKRHSRCEMMACQGATCPTWEKM